MSLDVRLYDHKTARQAKVTSRGALVVAAQTFDESVFKELAAADTAYNFFVSQADAQFLITGIILKADRQVSANTDAEVVIYEADAPTTTTADKVIFQTALVSGEQVVATGLNLLVSRGKFVNAKTSDDDIHMTLIGHFESDV